MFSRFGNYLYNSIAPNTPRKNDEFSSDAPPLKFKYTRPAFLHRNTDDEVEVSADHVTRPVMLPRSMRALPWFTGYAEAINAGKSQRNEDQAAYTQDVLRTSHPVSLRNLPPPASNQESCAAKRVENGASMVNGHSEGDSADGPAVDSEPKSSDSAEEGVLVADENNSEELKYTTPLSTPELQRKVIFDNTIPWVYFALFDGHAGSGVAVAASNTLHLILQEKLQSIADLLTLTTKQLNYIAKGVQEKTIPQPPGFQGFSSSKEVTRDSLIVGALESAFHEMDRRIAIDKKHYTMTGGCTALVALFMFGKLYVANAGDSRAVICRGLTPIPVSYDFTPETERNRLRKLAQVRPELLGHEFTHLEFVKRLARKDLGEKVLYRDAYMSGWCYKSITMQDLKFPLVSGEGKRSRLLATIGVTRGFGDHDLKALDTDVDIKPFLSSEPEVIVCLLEEDLTDDDVLVMGTDGLWDVTSNEKAAECVHKVFENLPDPTSDKYKCRYNLAAHDLVMSSRGKLRERSWRTSENKTATIDDISVFVIPLLAYRKEYLKWEESRNDLVEFRKTQPGGVQTL